MATGTLAPAPYQTVLDNDGVSLSGALVYTYIAGTTTPIDTFSASDLTVPNTNANPIVADAAGRFVAYLTPGLSYKFLYKTATGTTIRTCDNIGSVATSTVDLDVTGTAGVSIAAGEVAYLSDGSGGLTAGRWYLADADLVYGSLTCEIGVASAAIASSASGAIRVGGRMAGLTGLSAGANYYVSATAGALTTTAPANARLVGAADSTTSLVLASAGPTLTAPPVGSITMYGGTTAPALWLLCDGTSLLRSSYAALFTVIGVAFGSADGTHFTLPDLRQRFPIGLATSGTGSVLGGTGGAIDHTHTGPAHTHTGPSHTHTFTTGTPSTTHAVSSAVPNDQIVAESTHTHSGTTAADGTQATGSSGTGATGTANAPFQAVNFIIYARA